MDEGLVDQEEFKVADDAKARDLDGAVGGDVVADAREVLGELSGGWGLAEGGRPVVVEVRASRGGERGEAGVVDVVVDEEAVAHPHSAVGDALP